MERSVKFVAALVTSRWMVVVVSFFVMACSGATYIFGLYSGAIKSALQYNQQTLNTLSFFKDLGANVGIVSGLLNEVTPSWFVIAVGAGMNVFGYLMIWLAVTYRIPRPAMWQIYLYMCIGANSQTFANTGVMVTCVKNFPQSRGIVIGLLKGFVGLSGAIFTQLYYAIYGENASSLILLVAWFPAVVSLMFMFLIRPMEVLSQKNEKKVFYSFLATALLLAFFLMVVIVIENLVPLSAPAYKVIGTLTVLLILLNVGIAIKIELVNLKLTSENAVLPENNSCSLRPLSKGLDEVQVLAKERVIKQDMTALPLQNTPPTTEANSLINDPMTVTASPVYVGDTPPSRSGNAVQESLTKNTGGQGGEEDAIEVAKETDGTASRPFQIDQGSPSCFCNEQKVGTNKTGRLKFRCSIFQHPQRGDDFTILQALFSADMWILFIASTCGVGGTLTAIDNMGQIGQSQGYSKVSISTFVSLISIWNFLGRVISGFLSEFLLQKYRFPRPLMLTLILLIACVAHLLIAFAFPGTLYVASILIGLCFGAQWPILYSVISELFGLKYFATLYNFGGVSSPLGMYILSVRVAGHLYDKEARRQYAALSAADAASVSRSDLVCDGASCYRLTFFIMTGVSLVGSIVSAFLVYRTRHFYKQDIYARFRRTEETKGDSHLEVL